MHEKVRKQGRGKGERVSIMLTLITCRVGGESTAVFPSPLMLPP